MAVPLAKAAAAADAKRAAKGKPLAAIDGAGADAAGRELTKLLGLDKLPDPLTITAAQVIGVGADAAAYITVSDGSEMRFRSLREMTSPGKLMAEVVATTGAIPKVNQQQAMQAVALLKRYAQHVRSMTEDDEAIEWGINFLQAADFLDVDIDDQAQRWAAFVRLGEIDPRETSRQTNISVAAASLVLRLEDGSRLVRTDWMRAYVRSIEPRMSPAAIAVLLQRVGWVRRGREGRWKATRPGLPGQINLAFWLVPSGWDDQGEEPPAPKHEIPANGLVVTAGTKTPPARALARTRVGAVTSRNHGEEGTT